MSLFKNVLKVLFYILIAIGSVITVLDIFGYNVFSFLQPKMSLTTPELGKVIKSIHHCIQKKKN